MRGSCRGRRWPTPRALADGRSKPGAKMSLVRVQFTTVRLRRLCAYVNKMHRSWLPRDGVGGVAGRMLCTAPRRGETDGADHAATRRFSHVETGPYKVSATMGSDSDGSGGLVCAAGDATVIAALTVSPWDRNSRKVS